MVAVFATPVLSVTADAVRDLEGHDALSGLWTIFTKCRESLQDGPRLENIAWRLWHRELKFKGQDDSNLLDEKDHSMGEYAILDEKSAYRPPTPSEPTGFPPPYAVPSSEGDLPTPSTLPTCSLHEGLPSPSIPVQAASSTSPSSSPSLPPLLSPSIPQPTRRLSSASSRRSSFLGGTPVSVGRIIYDMLPSPSSSSSSGSSDTRRSAHTILPLPQSVLNHNSASSCISSPPGTLRCAIPPLLGQRLNSPSKYDPVMQMTAIPNASPPRDGMRPTKVVLPDPSSVLQPADAVSCLPTPEMEIVPAPNALFSTNLTSSHSTSASASSIPTLSSNIPSSTSSVETLIMNDHESARSPHVPGSAGTTYVGPPSPSLSESYARAHPAEVVVQEVGLPPLLDSLAQPSSDSQRPAYQPSSAQPHPPQETASLHPQPPTLVVVNPTPNPTPHPTPPASPLLSGIVSTTGPLRSQWLTPPGMIAPAARSSQRQSQIQPPVMMLPPSTAVLFNAFVSANNSAVASSSSGAQAIERAIVPEAAVTQSNQNFAESDMGQAGFIFVAVPAGGSGGELHPGAAVKEDDDRVGQQQPGSGTQLSPHHHHPQRPARDHIDRRSISSNTSDLSHTTSNTTASDRSSASGTTMTTTTAVSDAEHGDYPPVRVSLGGNLALLGLAPKRLDSLSTINSIPTTLADQRKECDGSEGDDIGMATVSDDEDSVDDDIEEVDEESSAMATALPSTATLATSGKKASPMRAPTSNLVASPRSASSTGNGKRPSLPGRTASSVSVTKRKRVSVGAPSRRPSRSRSTGGSSIGHSRSRSREPPSAGIGHAGFALAQAAVPLPPAPVVSRKAPVTGNGRGRAKFSVGRATKARGVVRRNSGGPGLGNEIDIMEKELERERKEQADMQRMRDQALEVERQRHLEHEERVRRTEEEIVANRERLEQDRLASERERRREVEQAEIERQRQLERLAAPNPVEGSSRRPARFNIGSNSDEGSGLGSKSAGSGSDMSGGNNMRGVAGLYSGTGKGKEKERAGQEVLVVEKQRMQNISEQPQRQQPQLEQHVQHHPSNQQPAHPHQQSQQLQPSRQLNKDIQHQLQMMQQTQLYRDHHFSSKPPSRQVSTKQLEPFRGLEKVVNQMSGKEREAAPALAPVSSKQPTNNNSSVTVAPPPANVDTDLAAKVRESLADPLLPTRGLKVVLATESEFETDSDDDGSWSSEDLSGDEAQEQRHKEEQLRRELVVQQERLQQEQHQRRLELMNQKNQQQPQQPARAPGVQRTNSSHYPAPNNSKSKQAAVQARQRRADVEGAARELQRQQSMITKLPSESFQDLAKARTRSVGLLTQLMNPNPEIFPANHPYRRGFSSGAIRPPQGLPTMAPMHPPHPPVIPTPPPLAPVAEPPAPAPVAPSVAPAPAPAPNPPAVPPRPPHRRHATTDDARRPPPSRTSMSPPMRAAGLQTKKSAAARPLPSQVQVGSVSTKAAPSVGLVSGVMSNGFSAQGSGSGGYRPKGRPVDQEMEEESESEAEAGKIHMSKSVAEEKLKALAQRRGIQPHRANTTPALPNQPTGYGDDDVPEWARVQPRQQSQQQHARTQSNGQNRRSLNSLQLTQAMPQHAPNPTPIPLGHPYNLPPPAAPMTPRTTRRQMLATELSESLRRNLLWERQVSKVNLAAVKRSASGGGSRHNALGGLQPLTHAPSMVQLHAKGTVQPQPQQQPQHQHQHQRDPRERKNGGGPPANEEERKKRAMARNRSWADDYHYSGW